MYSFSLVYQRTGNLSLCVRQEEWAVHSSEMLAVNSSLLELHLGKMGMTDTGMKRLSEGLLLNHRLRYLDLCW